MGDLVMSKDVKHIVLKCCHDFEQVAPSCYVEWCKHCGTLKCKNYFKLGHHYKVPNVSSFLAYTEDETKE